MRFSNYHYTPTRYGFYPRDTVYIYNARKDTGQKKNKKTKDIYLQLSEEKFGEKSKSRRVRYISVLMRFVSATSAAGDLFVPEITVQYRRNPRQWGQ